LNFLKKLHEFCTKVKKKKKLEKNRIYIYILKRKFKSVKGIKGVILKTGS